jgi:16S rRNA (cytidine1402-2'-O)-methyltransferase
LHSEVIGLTEPILYVVATPIGNLRDITLRALDVLKSVDVVAAEDTRVTQKLLGHHGIHTSLLALHQHNEREAAQRLLELLSRGKSVALVSDAGTPGISDPGAVAVAQVRAAGYRVVPVPGASAALAAISAAGMPDAGFCFYGFLPARKGEREKTLEQLKRQAGLLVFYEAPHRIEDCVQSMITVLGGERRLVIARELTKLFEQIHVCKLSEAPDWLGESEDHRRGEFVLLLEGCTEPATEDANDAQRVLGILLDELPLKQAVKLAVQITGEKKNALYQKALGWKGAKSG